MEVRAENNLLEERILDIIREEKGYSDQDDIEEETEDSETDDNIDSAEVYAERSRSTKAEKETINTPKPEPAIQDIEAEEVDEDVSVLEVAEEQETEA
jgi:hypothetical protein